MTCPLCAQAPHQGKCGRLPRGKWWCGLCLISVAPDGPPIPASLLLSNGAELTSKWCTRCAIPVCPRHRHLATTYAKAHPRCVSIDGDCRLRPPALVAKLQSRLEAYVPGFLTAGPIRCRVCGLPAFRKSLCSRHYSYVRQGRTELPVERVKNLRTGPAEALAVYVPVPVAERVKALAAEEGVTVSAWCAVHVEAAVGLPRPSNVLLPFKAAAFAESLKKKRPYRRRRKKAAP